MTNPFEDETAQYLALVNDEGQHSLWPATIPVPPGWRTALGPATRQECLDHIAEVWTDMRPASLAMQMDGAAGR
ncbi:MbtH family protein [Catenulispora sp. NL8]|uniref:MbtH family protein n=1 Tax=Catenulispora pinistramenti TaxID=2705254 RepID=A0ABS5L8V5_9ACTN|nr:MbtH family protein [Catenulispora pinistramenti]